MKNLFEELEGVLSVLWARDIESGTLWAEPIRLDGQIFLAMNSDRDLFLLIEESGAADRPDRDLKFIRIEFGVRYIVKSQNMTLDGHFTSIMLKSHFQEFSSAFCALTAALVTAIPENPNPSEIRNFVEQFALLFQSRPGPARERLKGLWGELQFVLIGDMSGAILAWHDSQWGARDFSFQDHSIEIKTTESQSRTHDFSLSQLVVGEKPLFVGSFLIDEDPNGKSVVDLFEAIREVIDPSLTQKLNNNFYDVVGLDIDLARDLKFEFRVSLEEAYKEFDSREIPKPSIVPNDPITSVQFRVDLTGIPTRKSI